MKVIKLTDQEYQTLVGVLSRSNISIKEMNLVAQTLNKVNRPETEEEKKEDKK